MKKLIVLTTLLSLLNCSTYAKDPKFYIGVENQSSTLDFSDGAIETANGSFNLYSTDYYADSYSSVTPTLGYQVSKYSAIHLSYFSDESEYSNANTGLVWATGALIGQPINVETETAITMYNFDTIHNLKLDKIPIRLLGILGASIIDIEAEELYNDGSSIKSNAKGFGINLGVGFEIDIHKHFSIVTKAKYTQAIDTDFEDLYATKGLDNITTLSTGIKIKF